MSERDFACVYMYVCVYGCANVMCVCVCVRERERERERERISLDNEKKVIIPLTIFKCTISLRG